MVACLTYMNRKQFQKLLKKYRKGTCTPAETIIIKNWINDVGRNEIISLSTEEEAILRDKYWEVINKHIHASKGTRTIEKRFTSNLWKYKAAASIILITAVSFLIIKAFYKIPKAESVASKVFVRDMVQVYNNEQRDKNINLPDGSRITLMPGSKLSFSEKFAGHQREVYLSGEAFFDVARIPERPFLVYSKEVITKVLGTSFRVKAINGDENVTVAVKTGKVYVYTNKEVLSRVETENVLIPNQQLIYNLNENKATRSLISNPQPVISFDKIKTVRFEDAPVIEIIKALEKLYGIKIELDEKKFAECTLTTSVTDGGIYNRLDKICKAIGATYSIEETHILIAGKGCN